MIERDRQPPALTDNNTSGASNGATAPRLRTSKMPYSRSRSKISESSAQEWKKEQYTISAQLRVVASVWSLAHHEEFAQ